ncbi:Transcriptional regulator [Collimonas arenae]|uniref:Transcriptional regulator n=1 Tax=Collimonas arenae TaxID=279058 RepID=A0A0A1FEH4_9BURK|nr:AraC family transcriptional regulator [Collimonas arenae]AIY42891.1 Transcriptional regulator [Collimonas arenae]
MDEIKSNSPLPGFISSGYVRLLYEYLEKHDVRAADLLGEAPPEIVDRGLRRYTLMRWATMLQLAAKRLNDPLLGLHLGQTITPAHLGALGYVMATCANLGAALMRLVEYQRLLYEGNPMIIQAEETDIIIEWKPDYGRFGPLIDESGIVGMLQIARSITGHRCGAKEVCFANPAPQDIKPYVDWFQCPVLFDQPATKLRFPINLLARPLLQADPILVLVLEQQVDAMLEDLPRTDDFENEVRRHIARLISNGEPELEHVAEKMHLSVRTLRRRLNEHGLNFRSLRENIRHRMAEHYLLDQRLHLAEIGQLLGYNDQSAFTRAFRRWTGRTPLSYQQEMLQGIGTAD